MSAALLRLGCPFWSFAEWRGGLYSADARPGDFLAQYGRVFGSVEGNTTFYHTPLPETVARWAAAVPPSFRFCFKLPQVVTHERSLVGVEEVTTSFLRAMEPLGDRLGPFMVQLPGRFGPRDLTRLERFLAALPRSFSYAVELRHRDFFDPEEPASGQVDDLLATQGLGRVVMDTRALRAGDADHPDIREARHKKPNLPLHLLQLGEVPVIRIVFHPEREVNDPYLDEWAARVAGWLQAGISPYVFLHTPSNRRTPQLARHFRERVARHTDLPELPAFPGESRETVGGQLSLL